MLVEGADRIIAMGGYNTVCETLSFEKRALIVPRSKPRQEQLIRAERMRNLGLLDYLEAESLKPEALSAWIARSLPRLKLNGQVNLNGLERLPGLAAEVLGGTSRAESENPPANAAAAPAIAVS